MLRRKMRTQVTQQRGEKEIRTALAKVWLDSQPRIRQRLATLEHISEKLRSGFVDEKCREDALEAAHKLSGALGMFGLNEASACATEIEFVLDQLPLSSSTRLAPLVARLRGMLEKAKGPHIVDWENHGS